VLTGTAKSVDTKTGSFELNTIMVVKVSTYGML
jgi:hypothetical protein